jgi:predicted glycoside hydrolase/deacetylase ChbG (UPF0249 family)
LDNRPSAKEVALEYERQILTFVKHFSRGPDHLDTHHHVHEFAVFFQALSAVARRWKLPVRRGGVTVGARLGQRGTGSNASTKLTTLKTTDYLFGNLEAEYFWKSDALLAVIENLPVGTSEIVCHPGICDADLRRISSFREGREKELKLFSDRELRKIISGLEVELIRFTEV